MEFFFLLNHLIQQIYYNHATDTAELLLSAEVP